MMLLRLLRAGLRQHALSSAVAMFSIALAAALLLTVWRVRTEASRAFIASTSTFDAVLGARGSKLQLVLNALYHLEASPGLVSAEDVLQIRKHPAVKRAIPIALGDNLYGWRIVGTETSLFTDVEYRKGVTMMAGLTGRLFAADAREAVLGSVAARALGLGVGGTFQPYHGLDFNPADRHDIDYTVVGVLAPTGTPMDRVIWIPLAGVQNMPGHDPKYATDVSAVLIQLRTPAAGMMLDVMYNRQGNRLTFAYPVATVVAGFFNRLALFEEILAWVAYLVALVAGAAVLTSVHGSLLARRRDLAILRALGARRLTVAGLMLGQATLLGLGGIVLGLGLHFALLQMIAVQMREQIGVILDTTRGDVSLLWIPLGLLGVTTLAGLWPAWAAYRQPAAENLYPDA